MTKLIMTHPDYTISDCGVVTKTTTKYVLSQWTGANGYLYVDLRKDGKGTKVALHRLLALTFIENPENKYTVNHIDGNKLNNTLENLEWNTVAENTQHAYDTGLQPYRRNYSEIEYYEMLDAFLLGESLTSISNRTNQSLTQLSLHIREAATNDNKLASYEYELKRQKAERNKETGKSQRKVITLSMIDTTSGAVLKTFSSVTEAQQFLARKSSGPISNVLAGRQKTAYGYKWSKQTQQNATPTEISEVLATI